MQRGFRLLRFRVLGFWVLGFRAGCKKGWFQGLGFQGLGSRGLDVKGYLGFWEPHTVFYPEHPNTLNHPELLRCTLSTWFFSD